MTRSQLDSVSELLQNSPLDLGGDVEKMRRVFDEMLGSAPLPDDVRTRTTELGGVPAVEVRAGAAVPTSGTVLYFHGGAYAIGSAAASVGLAAPTRSAPPPPVSAWSPRSPGAPRPPP
jgi:acetyl esterase/lipase